MTTSVIGLSIDCADALALARFWSEVLSQPRRGRRERGD
jgi:hypothetical protein